MRRRLLIALPIFLFLVVGVSAAANRHDSAPANPGFEDGGAATASPSGWRSAGDRGADFTEAGGHSGGFHLTHWSAEAYEVETTQQVRHLRDGWYTLRAWVRGSAGENESSIELDCGRDEARTHVPVSTSGWLQIVASARVEHGSCTIVLRTEGRCRRMDALRRHRARPRRGAALDSRRRRLEPREVRGQGRCLPHLPRPAGRRPRHPRGRGPELRAAARLGRSGGRLPRQGRAARDGEARQEAGPEGPRRSPLLGLLGRSRQAVDSRSLGGPELRPAAADLHRLHPRHRREPRRAGNAAGDDPARQRDQPRAPLGLLGDLDRLLDGRRRGGRATHGLPHGELGPRGPAPHGRLRRREVGVALDEGDAPPGRGRQQRHLPLVVRQRHDRATCPST